MKSILKKFFVLFVSLTMFFSNGGLITSILAKENQEVIGQTTFVDENGNIKTVDVYDGTTGEEYNPNLRRVTTANMVNFNCNKAGTTTNFTDYYTGQSGYLSKASAADAAFLGYENDKVKFMISGVTGLVDANLVEVVSSGTYYASNYEVNSNGKLYHYISNDVTATGNQGNFNYVGTAPSYLTKGIEYYSYDGHYFYKDYNVMINDYKNNVRSNSVNSNNPYYNYFQYLPLRSKTNYTSAELTTYLNKKANSSISKLNDTGDIFIKYQDKYGVNALMAASFAALESGWGKSSIALTKNNLFGLNAVDSNPSEGADVFKSVDDCIYNFTSSWMSKRYLNGTNTSVFRGGYFGDKASGIFGKYSSDPYEGEKCASIAENMDAGILNKDKNYYTIGIKDVTGTSYTNLNVRQSNSTSSPILYTTIKNPGYAFIVRDKNATNGFYEIQSDTALNSNRTAVSTSAEYNYDKDYAYVSSNYLTIVNNGNDLITATTKVYRLYTPITGEHLYTTDAYEVRVLSANGIWIYEGIGWYAPSKGIPVYRLNNDGLQNHLYTTDTNEVRELTQKHGWKLDNNGRPLFYSGGDISIYRLYNLGLNGQHHLTTDQNEYNVLPSHGWLQEGIGLRAVAKGNPSPDTFPL